MPLHHASAEARLQQHLRPEFAEVNLWRIQQAIAAGKLDAKAAIDADALVKAGVVRRAQDGVRCWAGELKSKLTITVYGATKSAIEAAVEKAGGSVKLLAGSEAKRRSLNQPPSLGRRPAVSGPACVLSGHDLKFRGDEPNGVSRRTTCRQYQFRRLRQGRRS
jgi:hypothetical protein